MLLFKFLSFIHSFFHSTHMYQNPTMCEACVPWGYSSEQRCHPHEVKILILMEIKKLVTLTF